MLRSETPHTACWHASDLRFGSQLEQPSNIKRDITLSQTAFRNHSKFAHDYFTNKIGLDVLHHHIKIPDEAGRHGVDTMCVWSLSWRLEKFRSLGLKELCFLSHPGQWLASSGSGSTLNVIFRSGALICFSQGEQRSPSDPKKALHVSDFNILLNTRRSELTMLWEDLKSDFY